MVTSNADLFSNCDYDPWITEETNTEKKKNTEGGKHFLTIGCTNEGNAGQQPQERHCAENSELLTAERPI